MRCFGASLWRFPSRLHARSETTGAATQRSRPSVLHLRTGVRIPQPPPHLNMAFDEELTRAFDTMTERLRGEIDLEVQRRTAEAIAAIPPPEPIVIEVPA